MWEQLRQRGYGLAPQPERLGGNYLGLLPKLFIILVLSAESR